VKFWAKKIAVVVVDAEHDAVCFFIDHYYALSPGKMIWNTDPCGIALPTVIRPPCDSTIDRQIESPIPIPSGLVVKNASKIRLASSGSIPVPESSTTISAP
jgi:hypothetical protein